MVPMHNYRSIPAALRNREPFNGNSMSATLSPSGLYEVWSYATVIATLDTTTGEKVINDRKYSHTTARHQNLVRDNL
jgi:hypothetical protein